jgi:hypothetical protein
MTAKPAVSAKPKGTLSKRARLLGALERLADATSDGKHVRKQDIVGLIREHGGYVRARKLPGRRAKIEPLTAAQLAARPKPTPWVSPYGSWGRDELAEKLGPVLRRPRRLD